MTEIMRRITAVGYLFLLIVINLGGFMPETNVETVTQAQDMVSEGSCNPPETSPTPSEETAQIKALLSEARATRDVLVGFRSAVESGTFAGVKMLDLAKGLAFLEAILKQNNAHIHHLQERIS
jgi:hypothetical protein